MKITERPLKVRSVIVASDLSLYGSEILQIFNDEHFDFVKANLENIIRYHVGDLDTFTDQFKRNYNVGIKPLGTLLSSSSSPSLDDLMRGVDIIYITNLYHVDVNIKPIWVLPNHTINLVKPSHPRNPNEAGELK